MQASESTSFGAATSAKALGGLILAAALSACQVGPLPGKLSTQDSNVLKRNSPEWRGQKFAMNRCSDCHSIGYGETSTLPEAPSFAAIANTPGLSKTTLDQWMRNHRNYPREMYFEIPAEHIDDLTAYMMTLRRPK